MTVSVSPKDDFSNSELDSDGPITTNKVKCVVCKRPVTAHPGDPAKATNTKDFLQWMHALEPVRYHEVLRAYPVEQHLYRDQKAHEVEMTDAAIEALNFKAHRDWLEQQFK